MSCLSFLLFQDTYRKERSLLYQRALKARLKHLSISTSTATDGETNTGNGEITIVDSEKGEDNRQEQSLHNSDLSLRDLNPIRPIWFGLRRMNNLTILFATGRFLLNMLKNTECLTALNYAFEFMVIYTGARTLGFDYGYNPLKIGLVTLAFGIGKYTFRAAFPERLCSLSYCVTFACTLKGVQWVALLAAAGQITV